MSFTFTVFISLQRNLHAYVSFSKGINWQKKHHSMFLSNVDPDLEENSGESTDLDQKNSTDRRISRLPYYSKRNTYNYVPTETVNTEN